MTPQDMKQPIREVLPRGELDRLSELLPADALEDALEGLEPEEITGPDGLLGELTRRLVERALGAELTEHLGYEHGQAPPGGACNARNGSTPKTVGTDHGPVRIEAPRDRRGTFEPQIVRKGQRRLAGLDEKIVALYAGGMTTREIETYMAELYGPGVGRDTVSRVTAAVLEDAKACGRGRWRRSTRSSTWTRWWSRSATGRRSETAPATSRSGVSCEGDREPLGIWWQESEGAKFWLAVLNDLHQRAVKDVLVCCVDGLAGFPEATLAVFPQAWVQTCIVHRVPGAWAPIVGEVMAA